MQELRRDFVEFDINKDQQKKRVQIIREIQAVLLVDVGHHVVRKIACFQDNQIDFQDWVLPNIFAFVGYKVKILQLAS